MRRESDGFWGELAALASTALVGWLIAVETTAVPVWPLYILIALAIVVFYCLWAAPQGRWPFKADPEPVPEGHAKQLRDLAATLRRYVGEDKYHRFQEDGADPDFLEAIFKAHFPRQLELVSAFSEHSSKRKVALSAFIRDAGGSLMRGFSEGDGWELDEIRDRFREHRWSIADGRGPELEEDDRNRSVSWDRKVVFRKPDLTSGEVLFALTSASLTLEAWTKECANSDAAKEMLAELANSRRAETAAVAALEPVIHHQEFRRARGCQVCYPP